MPMESLGRRDPRPPGAPTEQGLGFPREEREGISIFVVERDQFYRHFLEHALKKITRFVEFMPDGVTTMKRAKIQRPDLIVFDPVAARVDVGTFLGWTRGDPDLRTVPILLYSELDLEESSATDPLVRFLRKPFKEDALRETVGELLAATPSGGKAG